MDAKITTIWLQNHKNSGLQNKLYVYVYVVGKFGKLKLVVNKERVRDVSVSGTILKELTEEKTEYVRNMCVIACKVVVDSVKPDFNR